MMKTARSLCAGLVLAAALAFPASAGNQVLPPQDQSVATARVAITAGRSTVLTVDFDVTRIALTNPAVADATVVEPREILIDGKAPGTVTMILWGACVMCVSGWCHDRPQPTSVGYGDREEPSG